MKQDQSWRLFCAIEIPFNLRRQIILRANRLRETFPQVQASWTRDENLHLTLKFIGEVGASRASSLTQAVANTAAVVQPFEVHVERPGAFPKRVLWIGVTDPSGELARLQNQLDRECAAKGFPKEERAFHPHLTVARLKKPQGTQALTTAHKEMPFESELVRVNELVVIRSELSSKGSIYTIVSKHRLGG